MARYVGVNELLFLHIRMPPINTNILSSFSLYINHTSQIFTWLVRNIPYLLNRTLLPLQVHYLCNKDLMKGRWYHPPRDHQLLVQIIPFQLLLVLLILLISSMPTWHRLNNHLWALLKSKEILHLMILCQWDAIFKTYLPIHLRQSTRASQNHYQLVTTTCESRVELPWISVKG